MRLQLSVWKWSYSVDYSEGKFFRFAIVDLDKAKGYPLNFVCLLPTRVSLSGKPPTSFERIFGSKCLDIARKLLTDTLKNEDDEDVKSEIERRLKLLDSMQQPRKAIVSLGENLTSKCTREASTKTKQLGTIFMNGKKRNEFRF